jgi:putative N6-adenine-specific DNA methylase
MTRARPVRDPDARLALFAACAPGLEALLLAEVAALPGAAAARSVAGGVEVEGDLGLLYRMGLELGLALKLLVRLGRFEARHFGALVDGAAAAPWERWLAPGAAVAIRASCARSRLYHSGAVAERVQTAIEQRLGGSVRVPDKAASPGDGVGDGDDGAAAMQVQVRLAEDVCTLSIDAGGAPLHRRGYRQATGKAPLREDLARALLLLSGWDRATPLVDPFCGSGTILIEADLLARRLPPGAGRAFAFERAPGFDAARWQAARTAALAAAAPPERAPRLLGSDRDPGAIAAAQGNAARAGAGHIELVQAPLGGAPAFAAPPGPAGALVTNPPWGQRTGRDRTLLALYQSLGTRARGLPADWRVALAVADPRLGAATGLGVESRLMTDAGGVKVYFMVGGAAPAST